jgi:hypothetical protein
MADIDVTQLQLWLRERFDRIDERMLALEGRMEAIEDRMTILEHAFVGFAAQINIRLRDKGATP